MKVTEDIFGDKEANVSVLKEGQLIDPPENFTFWDILPMINKMMHESFDETKVETQDMTYKVKGVELRIEVDSETKNVHIDPKIEILENNE